MAIAESNTMGGRKLTKLIHLAVGMKAMVLLNIATEADIANGTRGPVEKILLDKREELEGLKADENGDVHLKYPLQ